MPSVKLIGTGDIFRELKTIALESNPFIDALLLDFSTNDIITYLFNNHKGMVIPNIIYRDDELLVEGKETHHSGIFDTPVPRWDLFNMKSYRFPFAKKKPFASILTDFGCPYSCDFCPISSLGYKLREISSVVEELICLKNLGIKELYIRDQTFGVSKQRTSELLEVMLKENLNFSWTCLTRTDILDDELLALMKKAGCHTIMIGI